jgi:hypothetical protein
MRLAGGAVYLVSYATGRLPLRLTLSADDKKTTQDVPIRILALIISQIIQIDNEPHLLVVEHAADRLAVVVVGVSLYCQYATPPSAKGSPLRMVIGTHIVVQEFNESTTAIPHQVISQDGPGLGIVFGHFCRL